MIKHTPSRFRLLRVACLLKHLPISLEGPPCGNVVNITRQIGHGRFGNGDEFPTIPSQFIHDGDHKISFHLVRIDPHLLGQDVPGRRFFMEAWAANFVVVRLGIPASSRLVIVNHQVFKTCAP